MAAEAAEAGLGYERERFARVDSQGDQSGELSELRSRVGELLQRVTKAEDGKRKAEADLVAMRAASSPSRRMRQRCRMGPRATATIPNPAARRRAARKAVPPGEAGRYRDQPQRSQPRRSRVALSAHRLLRELDRPRLPDDRDPDLTWVLELLLDLFRDVPRDHLRLHVVDVLGLDHHSHLAARLHREGLGDTWVARADLLEPLHRFTYVSATPCGLQAGLR